MNGMVVEATASGFWIMYCTIKGTLISLVHEIEARDMLVHERERKRSPDVFWRIGLCD
jgi:hypothetical protein